jgi:hypothetical protein
LLFRRAGAFEKMCGQERLSVQEGKKGDAKAKN